MCAECEEALILMAKYVYQYGRDEGYRPDITDVSDEDAIKTIDELIRKKLDDYLEER